jgi:methyl-accepting chemotaxis protein
MSLIDMYHDGLRGMVYKAIYEAEGADEATKKQSHADFKEDSQKMRDLMKSLLTLNLKEQTKKEITEDLKEVELYIKVAEGIIDSSMAGKRDDAIAKLPDFGKQFDVLEEKLGILGDAIVNDADVISRAAIDTAHTASTTSSVVILICLVIGSIATWLVVNKLMVGITNTVEMISSCVHDLQNSSQKMNLVSNGLTDCVDTQVSSITESVTAMDEISAMIKNNDASSSNAASLSEATKESALSGKSTVDKMIVEMQEISHSFDDIQQAINQNNENINQIVGVISQIATKTQVINDIVFQTKLLSFNASVEAARAGESGKGFAVVAEEIGNLAGMSGKASSDISTMLLESQNQVKKIAAVTNENIEKIVSIGRAKVNSGSEVAKYCLDDLNKIVDNISELDGSISQISVAIKEQSVGVVEVNTALKHLDDTTNETTEMSNRTKEASEGLRIQSHKLRTSIQDLRIILGSEKAYKVPSLEESAAKV